MKLLLSSLMAVSFCASTAQAQTMAKVYPKATQAAVMTALKKSFEANLEKIANTYNARAKRVSSHALLLEAGVSKKDFDAVFAEYGDDGSKPLKVKFEDGELSLSKDGNVLALGPDELIDSTIKVNGSKFFWDPKKKFSANFKAYNEFFKTAVKVSSRWSPLDLLVAPAYADGHSFQLQIAGISLFFFARNYKGEVLETLDAKIQAEVESCKSGKETASAQTTRNIVEAVSNSSEVVNSIGLAHPRLRSCGDLKKFAKETTARKFVHEDDNHGPIYEEFATKFPPELCRHIDELSACLAPKIKAEKFEGYAEPKIVKRTDSKGKVRYEENPGVLKKDDWKPSGKTDAK